MSLNACGQALRTSHSRLVGPMRSSGRVHGKKATQVAAAVLGSVLLIAATSKTLADDPLPSWNDTTPKKAIIDFVERVTKPGSPDFVRPEERIATFDNDGTLWAEQPIYFQFLFAMDRIKALAPQHPEWKTKEPFKSVLTGDTKGLLAAGEKGLLEIMARTHAGMSTAEFDQIVREWFKTARHPRFHRPYNEMVYQPMLELLAYLRANGFKTFIVSGGGVEFMRAFAPDAYGIPPDQIVGSMGKLKYEMQNGKPVLIKLPQVLFIDDKAGKPEGIQTFIGQRPIFAFGNSDGDQQMLEWTAAGRGARFMGLVHHDDAEREWAYDRKSHIGTLDKAWDEAVAKGWTVVSMKDDWNTIFPNAPK
jgi:phosphoglycolate phosphatase-like HAD superfamily hydrolase